MSETMVNLTIEGRPASVPAGTSILEAAKTVGILIPHYCYHPGLPVVGSCRMCLVEVEKAPKLAPGCSTAVAEGQVVHVYSEKALEARKGVLEMLLINHPLDCPICDKSGECELQDYTFQEGRADSRYREAKRFNPLEDFGGDVMYVATRCILCTRCVRFMDDIHEKPVICVAERGDRAYIAKATDEGLTQAWAANVIDLCPVGALLSKDFLNRARAWELDRTASICTGCSQGCNVTLELRDQQVVRIRPRGNADVNKFFMCDHGRLNYRWLNRSDRLDVPMAGGNAVDWEVAVAAAARALKGKRAFVVANASLSNETMYLLKRLTAKTGGAVYYAVPQGEEAPLPGVPDLSLRADRAANGTAAELFGFTREAKPLTKVGAGDVAILVDVEPHAAAAEALAKADAVIVIGTAMPAIVKSAVAVLPIANMAEEEGTLTNLRGRVQRYLQARAAPGMARPAWFALSDLLSALGDRADYASASAVFDSLAKSEKAFSGMSYDSLALAGALVQGANAGATA